MKCLNGQENEKMKGDEKMFNEDWFIINEGIRIGFFQNKKDAQEAMNYCDKGIVMDKKEWERRRALVENDQL